MKSTINATDVAKLAGVSQSSVSRVYFEGAKVSKKTREKVLAAAAALGYRPNEFARSLITNRTKIIGLVMKGVKNPFYPQVLTQFTNSFKKFGYSILFVHTNSNEIQAEDVETLLNYHVAGVVITDATMSLDVLENFKVNRIPLVFFNRKLSQSNSYSVCCNNLNAGRVIAQYLITEGLKDAAYISGNENTSTSLERERGFREVLTQNQLSCTKYASDYTYEGGYETVLNIIKNKNLPSAFFVANDIMALGVLDALRKQAIQVPEQVKVIGFDNIGMSSWPAYELTTWEQPIEEMVEKTVTYLLSEIAEYTGLAEAVELEGMLIERETA